MVNTIVRAGNFSARLKPGLDNTTIKYSPEYQASEISDPNLKFELAEPQRLEINWFDTIEYHYKFELEEPINDRYNWYAFQDHVDIYDDEGDVIISPTRILDVPYFPQNDNIIRYLQTCNMTCAAMVVEYFYPGTNRNTPGQLEDSLTEYCVRNYGYNSIYYHHRIVDTLKHWNVKSTFSTTTRFSKIKHHLDRGNPVIYSGKFTKSGHIIVLRGYDETGFWVNDPYGEWYNWGYDRNTPNNMKKGENLHYSYNMMGALSNSGRQAGWAHLCEKM
ncbi:MAG: C39 family peptidase [Okeania sp. SIO2C9]|uniref:C39 family peptidase n=1 Tax=Okeania sp. SIO2C9 TaxID=2607791 RepID=UPI0013BF76EA|nr:C39 family peptidase [Okeania sp. SIO2C9]NEQ73938.1 C39 family peptidase [Okeania sp. SIO2C9]